jgi:tetratricopeptide (TPR) repeat protein
MKFQQLSFSILSLLIVFSSCSGNTEKSENQAELTQEIILTEADLFVSTIIKSFLKGSEDASKKEANELFLNGLDSYKNKKDLKEAQMLFTTSLIKYPTPVAYYELGNVFMDKKEYQKALDAYKMAESIGYEPFSKVLYNIACSYSQLDSLELSGNYLEYAIQAGYTNIDNLNKDKDLAKLRENWRYSYHVKKGLAGVSNADNLFWVHFKKQFNTVSLPYQLENLKKKIKFSGTDFISYDYEKYISEMRDEKFSRDVSKGYYYYAQLPERDKFVSLIYATKEEFLGENAPIMFRLATFTHEGKLIDKMVIAGRLYGDDPLLMFSIDKNWNFTITSYETEYKKNPSEHGYENNPIVSKTEIEKNHYVLTENGKIENKSKVLASR